MRRRWFLGIYRFNYESLEMSRKSRQALKVSRQLSRICRGIAQETDGYGRNNGRTYLYEGNVKNGGRQCISCNLESKCTGLQL